MQQLDLIYIDMTISKQIQNYLISHRYVETSERNTTHTSRPTAELNSFSFETSELNCKTRW